jgi:hypothetical protein
VVGADGVVEVYPGLARRAAPDHPGGPLRT